MAELKSNHPLWEHEEMLLQWHIGEGLNRYAIRNRLIEKYNLTAGVDSIRTVLTQGKQNMEDGVLTHDDVFAPAPEVHISPKVNPRYWPCGNKVVIATKNNKNHGWQAGQPKPCKCILCGPIERRERLWEEWKQVKYMGFYLCVGAMDAVGCDRVRFCAGPQIEEMICRECFELPPVYRDTTTIRDPSMVKRKA